jgi:transcriptional regulator with XRE-family HTH domain
MDDRARRLELADFLRTRRYRLSPLEIGVPEGLRRRTPGLKREELAAAAGISTSLYAWLEQARDIAVSERVLNGLARALRLTEAEKAHLFELALARPPVQPVPQREAVSQTITDLLALAPGIPAIAFNLRWDVLAWNEAAKSFFFDYERASGLERNILWYTFLNPVLKSRFIDWTSCARDVVARFRNDYTRNAGDAAFIELVEALTLCSPEFAQLWRLHDVLPAFRKNTVDFIHPAIGPLALRVVSLSVSGEPGLKINLFLPAADGSSAARLSEILATPKRRSRPSRRLPGKLSS